MKREDIIRWWESRRLKYNAYAVFSGVLCLVGMKVFNSASVNFFVFPILVLYLLALNVAYTIRYMFIIWNKKSVNEQILFRWMTGGTIALNLLLGLLVVTLVRQRQYKRHLTVSHQILQTKHDETHSAGPTSALPVATAGNSPCNTAYTTERLIGSRPGLQRLYPGGLSYSRLPVY